MGESDLWRYSVGHRGVNRVTVYERRDSPVLYVEWWDDQGRHQQSLRTATGHPITDQGLAKKVADRMAEAQEAKRNAIAARELFGIREDRTLGDLLRAMHTIRGPRWSDNYARDQKRFRKFWLARLGKDTSLRRITPAYVDQVVAETAKDRGWSNRTRQSYLRYIVDAFYFAQEKLKWLDEVENLSAVDMPAPKSKSKAYSLDELRKLLPELRKVDPRAGLIGDVAWQGGRRLNAVRTLTADCVQFEGELAVLTFPEETDKAKRSGEVALAGEAVDNLRALMETPAVRASGLLCPRGELSSDKVRRKPVRKETLIRVWLRDAEKAAGVEYVKGRGYHGIKRRFATATSGMKGRAKQSGTNEDTLRRIYEQDDLAPKVELARALAEMTGEDVE